MKFKPSLLKPSALPLFALLTVLFFLSLQPVNAVVITDLYTVELPVVDQTADQRRVVFDQAFLRVLTKVSGMDTIQNSTIIPSLEEASSRYVKQFSYLSRQGVDDDGNEIRQLYLKIDFDQQLIERLLRKNNLPIWGQERPSSLLIINSQVDGVLQLVAQDTVPEVVDQLDMAALNMGVPILFPLMDLEDISLIGSVDVSLRAFDVINILAARYEPDVVVVGEMIQLSAETWRGSWDVRFAEQVFTWQYRADTQQQVVDELIAHLARLLAIEYALADNQNNQQALLLSVSSTRNMRDLMAVHQYLQSLNVVESVRITLVSAQQVQFLLELRSSIKDLQRLIGIGNMLEQQALPQVNAQSDDDVVIRYDFIGRGISN